MKMELAAILILGAVLCSKAELETRHRGGGSSWGGGRGSGWGDWDNNDSWSGGHSGSRPLSCRFTPQQNKKIVKEFYQEVLGNHNVQLSDKYISNTTYIQHNPMVADGLEAFKAAATEWYKGVPPEKIDFQRDSAEGDLVWLHIRVNQGGAVKSVIDIFRMECGKIVEHWDAIQDMPATSANNHPLF